MRLGRSGSSYSEGNARVARARSRCRTGLPKRRQDRHPVGRAGFRRASCAHARRRRRPLDADNQGTSRTQVRSMYSTPIAATTASSRDGGTAAWHATRCSHATSRAADQFARHLYVDPASRDRGQSLRTSVPDFGGRIGGPGGDDPRRYLKPEPVAQSTLRAELGLGPDAVIGCMVAIMRDKKGHEDLITAAGRCSRRVRTCTS